MPEILVKTDELEKLKQIQIKHRRDWPAAFSTNIRCEVWPFCCYGHTSYENREFVHGSSKTIDDVAHEYLKIRRIGGRFFLDELGAFYKDELGFPEQFVTFRFDDRW